MQKSDEQHTGNPVRDNVQGTDDAMPVDQPPSKTRRKAAMHALQDVGEAMVELEPRQFTSLLRDVELPERLRDALVEARNITAHGGRKRQLQFIGKLMREVDPAPIAAWLDRLAHGRQQDAARMHVIESWRERLLSEPDALDALAALHPTLDRPRLRALIAKARAERAASSPPHAYRELFRAVSSLFESQS
ncbi:MAG: ribosome biogenesis factor YjgA [Casimicrobiaceae bacterium]